MGFFFLNFREGYTFSSSWTGTAPVYVLYLDLSWSVWLFPGSTVRVYNSSRNLNCTLVVQGSVKSRVFLIGVVI